MNERYDLNELLREIGEDERENDAPVVLSQENIQQMIRARDKKRSVERELPS